jgi:hypothetical protein
MTNLTEDLEEGEICLADHHLLCQTDAIPGGRNSKKRQRKSNSRCAVVAELDATRMAKTALCRAFIQTGLMFPRDQLV